MVFCILKMRDVNPEPYPMGYESGREMRPIMMQSMVMQMNNRQSHTRAQLQAFLYAEQIMPLLMRNRIELANETRS
jgi:hypothetical protein